MPTSEPLEDTPITSGLKKHQILREYHDMVARETPRTVLGNLILHRNAPDAPAPVPPTPLPQTPPSKKRRWSRSSIPARLIQSSPARRSRRSSRGPANDAPSSPLLASFSDSSHENVRPVRTKRAASRKPTRFNPQIRRTSQNRTDPMSEASLPDLAEPPSPAEQGSLSDFERTAPRPALRARRSPAARANAPDFRGAVRSQSTELSLELTVDETTAATAVRPIRGRRRREVPVEERRFAAVVASQEPKTPDAPGSPNEDDEEDELPSAIVGEGMLAASTPNVLTSTRMMARPDVSALASSSSELDSLDVAEGTSQVRPIRNRLAPMATQINQFAEIVAQAPSPSTGVEDNSQESLRDLSQSEARRMTRSARKSAFTPKLLRAQSGLDRSGQFVEALAGGSFGPENPEPLGQDSGVKVVLEASDDHENREILHAVKVLLGEKLADRTLVSHVLNNLDPTESVKELFKRPATPPPKRSTAKKRAFKPDPQQLFNRKDVKFQFERFSKQKVTSKCMPILMEISERFCQKVIKSLNQRIEQDPYRRTTLCLADMKSVMEEYGFIPSEDPNNSHLINLLQESLPKLEADLVVPYAVWNGKPNQGTMPEDAWDALPNRGRKRQKKKH